ncbi:hypothetical protein [Deinococcus ruber]|uniref:hypothetical protein n=1 Tax=Deinococcus ruber TaxID=1848197 RepID=UPI001665A246|nr:hypothetical protein [Deinococcus ruber]
MEVTPLIGDAENKSSFGDLYAGFEGLYSSGQRKKRESGGCATAEFRPDRSTKERGHSGKAPRTTPAGIEDSFQFSSVCTGSLRADVVEIVE